MDKIPESFKNIEGGPISTILGVFLFVFGGLVIWNSYEDSNTVTWVSVEVGLFLLGIYFLGKSDKWIRGLFEDDE